MKPWRHEAASVLDASASRRKLVTVIKIDATINRPITRGRLTKSLAMSTWCVLDFDVVAVITFSLFTGFETVVICKTLFTTDNGVYYKMGYI
jgi:hypothetical protein